MMYSLSENTWTEKEKRAAYKTIETEHFTMGNNVLLFEEQAAKKFGSKYAVMSNSGSSANLLMISALVYSGKLEQGDEVLVTAVSWSTTYFPICQCGLKIRFVDIDRYTLNVDVNKLEQAITKDTKVLLAVNLLGNPNEYGKLADLCKEHNLFLLEDNCESMGARYHNKFTGTFGCIGTFSTYYSHHLCTIEGGISVTDDEELYHYMLAIRSHGWTRQIPDGSSIYKKKIDKFYESFNFIVPGYNLRPIELEAAVGIEQLSKLDLFLEQRRKNALYLKKEMKDKAGYRLQKEIGQSSWFGFAIILEDENKGKRDQYIKKFGERGIEVRPIVAGNFVRQKAVQYLNYTVCESLSNADEVHENGFFIGNYSKPMEKELDMFLETLAEVK